MVDRDLRSVKVGGAYRIERLGEITITQNLSQEQRTALDVGTALSDPKAPLQQYRLKGKLITIDPKNLVVLPKRDDLASLASRFGAFVDGLKRKTPHPGTPRGREIAKSEKAAIVQADREAAARAMPLPLEAQHLTDNRGVGARAVDRGRPLPTARATTHGPAPGSPSSPPSTQETLRTAPRIAPTAEQADALERALSGGQTQVANAGGNRPKVTLKNAARVGGAVVGAGLKVSRGASSVSQLWNLVDERIPALDPSALVQAAVARRVAAGVDRGIQLVNAHFPPPDEFVPDSGAARARYLVAKGNLQRNGSLWRAQLRPASQYDRQTWEEAHLKVLNCLSDIDQYDRHLAGRIAELAAKRDELYPIAIEVDAYAAALFSLADELEVKTGLALILPAGYFVATELFSLSQSVRGLGGRVRLLEDLIRTKDLAYGEAIDAGNAMRDQLDALDDEWSRVAALAEQATGL